MKKKYIVYQNNLYALLSSIKLQYKVIHALVIREIHTRYGRNNLGFLWIIGEPILFCAGVAIVWTAIRPAREHGLGMTAIVVTGYIPLTMWRHCLQRAVKAFEANGSLLYHRHVTPFDIIAARTFLEIIGTIMAGLVVTFFATFFGYMSVPQDLFIMIIGYIYHIVFCCSVSLLAASLSELSDIVEKAISIISYLSIPFTGCFIMVSWLPLKYQWVLLLSPMANNLEMIRRGQFGIQAHTQYDLFYNTSVTFFLLFFGIYLTFSIRKHIEING